MNFLNLEGLKLVLSSLLSKISVAFDALEARVTSAESNKVNKSGDTMTGSLDMGNNEVKNVKELKGNKITTTSTSETDPNVKVESLKVRDDRVDILKKTTTADDGSTSASSAAYFKNGYMEVNGDFKAKGNINTAASINADGGVSTSGSIETTNGSVKAGNGVDINNAYGGVSIYEEENGKRILRATYDKTGFVTSSSGDDIYFSAKETTNNIMRRLSGLVLEHSDYGFKIRLDVKDQNGNLKSQLVLDPAGSSEFKIYRNFNISTAGGVVMQFGSNGGGPKLRLSSSCNFTGDVTNNEFKMIGNYCFKDVADHVTALPSGTTDEEKTWLENYLHNLFLDLKRSKLDEANAATEDELNALLVNSYDGSESQLNMLVASSGGLSETINVGDNANVYICNNGDAYLAGSGATNSYTSSTPPLTSNESIENLYVLNGITSIGNYTFYNCKSLTSITMGNSVTSIGKYAFTYCKSLTSITIPDSVTSIGSSAFNSCTSLMSITMGNSVTSIGNYAFAVCESLTSIIIPDSVTSISTGAFSGCTSLTSITIGNSVTKINMYAFSGCTSLTSITIPNSVTSIASNAFGGCTSLTSITINKAQNSITGQPWGATGAEIIWTGGE